jgi:hypothetical protein
MTGNDALLNQLWEDAAHRTNELATHAEAGLTAATEVAAHAQSLGQQAVEAAKALHDEYQQAIAVVTHAAQQARHASDEARRAVADVPEEARGTGQSLVDLLKAVHDELQELGALRVKVVGEVATAAQQADHQFSHLAQQVLALSNGLDHGVRQAGADAEALREILEKGGTEIETARGTIHETLRQLGQNASTFTTAVGEQIVAVLRTMADSTTKFCNAAVQGVNSLAATTRGSLLDETEQDTDPTATWVDWALVPVHTSASEFVAFVPTASAALTAAVAVVLDGAEKAVTGLETVSRSLQAALPRTNA